MAESQPYFCAGARKNSAPGQYEHVRLTLEARTILVAPFFRGYFGMEMLPCMYLFAPTQVLQLGWFATHFQRVTNAYLNRSFRFRLVSTCVVTLWPLSLLHVAPLSPTKLLAYSTRQSGISVYGMEEWEFFLWLFLYPSVALCFSPITPQFRFFALQR